MQNVSASLPNRARETTGTDTLDSELLAKVLMLKAYSGNKVDSNKHHGYFMQCRYIMKMKHWVYLSEGSSPCSKKETQTAEYCVHQQKMETQTVELLIVDQGNQTLADKTFRHSMCLYHAV